MDTALLIKVIIMGIVEGLTEFLPISSTGHLILAGSLLNFTGEKVKVFEIVIQAGAMLAVCWEYRHRIIDVIRNFSSDAAARRFVANLLVAFLPAVVLGLMFGKLIKAHLFAPVPVALAFIIGAFIILIVERRNRLNEDRLRIHTVDEMTLLDAFKSANAVLQGAVQGIAELYEPLAEENGLALLHKPVEPSALRAISRRALRELCVNAEISSRRALAFASIAPALANANSTRT